LRQRISITVSRRDCSAEPPFSIDESQALKRSKAAVMKTTIHSMFLLVLNISIGSASLPEPGRVSCDALRVDGVPSVRGIARARVQLASPSSALLGDKSILISGTDAIPATVAASEAKSLRQSAGIRFTENRGQVADTDGRLRPEILYTADAPGARLYFFRDGISFVFSKGEEKPAAVSEATGRDNDELRITNEELCDQRKVSVYRMDMRLVGCNANARVRAEQELEGYSNYYLAHCPDGVTFVHSYGRIVYENVYDNIDMVYYSSLGRMKYEFVVRPGGDPSDIRLHYSGADGIRLDKDGDLVITTPLGGIEEQAPCTYQDGTSVESSFSLRGQDLGFDVEDYDETQPLIIDPWATYCGGSADDNCRAVATDTNGNVFVEGSSASLNFPVSNAYQSALTGSADIVALKYDAYGSLQWSTYYGGSAEEGQISGGYYGVKREGNCVDNSGNTVIVTESYSTDFPVSSGAFQSAFGGDCDGVLVKLSPAGTRIWATYLGGSDGDFLVTVATDSNGNIVCGGSTRSDDFPVLGAFQSVKNGPSNRSDVCVTKFNSAGQLMWSTYMGGSDSDGAGGISVASDNSIIITGVTGSQDFPVLNAFQTFKNVGYDILLARFSPNGGLLWSTYYGGTGDDWAHGVCVDPWNNIIVTGYAGPGFPTTAGAFQSSCSSYNDVMLVKFSLSGSRIWATYFGGANWEYSEGVVADGNGNIYFTGYTQSTNFPLQNAYQSTFFGGIYDAFVAVLSPTCTLLWSTYFGGTDRDFGWDIALGQSGDVLIAGFTGYTSPTNNFPVLNAQQAVTGGNQDGFVAAFTANGVFPVELSTLQAFGDSRNVTLSWSCENETDNAGFAVERRSGSNAWEHRGFVAGAGTRTLKTEYSFLDDAPPSPSRIFYRLRQVDLDGRETISPEVEVQWREDAAQSQLIDVYPNPSSGEVFVRIDGQAGPAASLAMYDRLGREVYSFRDVELPDTRLSVLQLSLSQLPPGMYYLRVETAHAVRVHKILLE
jgi:hypothetical protein